MSSESPNPFALLLNSSTPHAPRSAAEARVRMAPPPTPGGSDADFEEPRKQPREDGLRALMTLGQKK